jgi:hypothetical protein
MKKIIRYLVYLLFLAICRPASAQQDTLADLRRFVQVCNGYKQLPLQLDVDIRSSGNWMAGAMDTGEVHARFNLSARGSYIAMDGLEQVANDSLLLVVNERTRRMLLYANHEPVATRLQHYLGGQLSDSTLAQWAGKYAAGKETKVGDTTVIPVESRATLSHTTLAKVQIRLAFDAVTRRPYTVSQVERSLAPVSDSLYRVLTARPEWAGKTVSVGDSSFYLVREKVRVFRFRAITHLPEPEPPVKISDRVVADVSGGYQPAKAYAVYKLTKLF